MAGSDKTVKVTLVAVATPLTKGMAEASQATSKLGKDIDTAGSKASAFGASTGKAGDALKGLALTAGAFAGAAVVAFLRDSVQAAGDLEQSVGGVDAVFGSASKQVHDFGMTAADAVGLSRNQFNELATVTGALLKNSGIEDFSKATLDLTKRAADVSATFGGTAKDAVEAFNSALKGEYNPIEKYGVKLNETAVNAALAAKGLDGLKGSALEQAKAQERINIIMAQTADHAGRFASEANTLQGQQQRLTAAWEDAKAALGQSLLPVLTNATAALSDGVSAVVAMANAWNELPGPVQAAIVGLTAFVALRGPLNGALGGLSAAGERIPAVMGAIGSSLGDAYLAGEKAGGGFRGAAAGAKSLTGNLGTFKLSAADAALAVVAVAGAANELAQALARVEAVDPAALGQSLADMAGSGDVAAGALGKLFRSGGAFADDLSNAADALDAFGIAAARALSNDLDSKINRLTDFGTSSSRFADQVGQVDAALAAMVRDGNVEGATAAYERLMASAAKMNAEGEKIDLTHLSSQFSSYRDALDAAAGGNTGLAGSALEAAAATKQQQDALDEAQKAVDKYIQSLVSAGMAVLSTRDAQRSVVESLAEVTAQLEKNGQTLDINTEAGRANQTFLDSQARSMLNLADAVYKETGSENDFRASLAQSRGALIQTAQQLGMTEAEAIAYADSILRIPASKHTNITTNAAAAIGDVDRLQARINQLRGNTVDVGVRYVDLNARPNSIAGGITKADGGYIRGPGTGTSDSIPAWLSNGEYVVKAAAVRQYGVQFLDRVNQMRFAGGGPVSRRESGTAVSPEGVTPDMIAAALDGARLKLGSIDPITREVAATLLTAHSRGV